MADSEGGAHRGSGAASPHTRRRFLQGLGGTAAVGATGFLGWRVVTDSDASSSTGRDSVTSAAENSYAGDTSPRPSPALTADVRQLGAVGDGKADDTAAFETALRTSSVVSVPPGTYLITRALTLPPTTRMMGSGKYNTLLLHGHDDDFARLSSRSSVSELSIDGQGRTFAGRGLVVPDGEGQQSLQSVSVLGFEDPCLDFEGPDAGSQFRAAQLDIARVDAGTGTGRYAIRIAPDRQLASVPRSFMQVETQGQCAIDFGGCNDMYVVASTLGDLNFTPESRGVNISASRLLNQTDLTIDGHGITITGCDIAAQLTLASGCDHVVVAPNSFNRLPVIDMSGNNRHQLPPAYQ